MLKSCVTNPIIAFTGALCLALVNVERGVAAETQPLPRTIISRPHLIADADLQFSPDLKAILAGRTISGVITSKTPSPIRLSIPSLWWITDQLAALDQFGNKFIQEWIAYPLQPGQAGRVDLLVNRQQWSLLDYFQRYQFVNKFSAIARSFGYNTRVYDHPDRPPVAMYACDFTPDTAKVLQSSSQSSPQGADATTAVRAELANDLSCRLQMAGMANSLKR